MFFIAYIKPKIDIKIKSFFSKKLQNLELYFCAYLPDNSNIYCAYTITDFFIQAVVHIINYLWTGMIIFSFVCALFNFNVAELSQGILTAAQHGVQLCFNLLGGLCFWSGIMEIAEQSGLTRVIGRLLSPVLRLIFPSLRDKSEILGAISMNVTANLLGLGNAATPLGIEAMRLMQQENENPLRASDDMVNFVVMNTAAIEFIPTTLALMRLHAGSSSPFDIVPVILIDSVIGLTAGLLLSKIITSARCPPLN